MSQIRLEKEGMYNDQGKLIDLYIPRKCAVTNKVIHAKDAASVQLNIGEVKLSSSL
jgi:small subunit ribosomal protein S21e